MKKGRKLAAFAISAIVVSFGFCVVLALVILFPTSQASIVSLFNTFAAYIGGACAAFTGAHMWTDLRVIQQGLTQVQNVTRTVKTKYYDDPTI